METQMNKPSKGIAVLGFFLTFLMVLTLIFSGILMAVKTTLLSGGDINEVLENTNIYGTITDVVTSEITANTEGTGLSKDAVAEVFSEDILKDAAKNMTDAIKNNEEIDLSEVKDQCMNVVTEVSEKAVDDILDEISSTSDVVSIEVLQNSEILKQIEADYNVDVTTVISDYVEEEYGSTTVNIADINIEQVKAEAKASLKETVIPTIEETVDEYIVEVNATVNDQIKEMNEEYDISGVINQIESLLSLLTTIMIVTIVVSVVFAILQVVVVYRKRMNKGFRNVSIATLIAGIVVAVVGIIINVLKGIIMGSMESSGDSVETAISDFIETNIGAVGSRTLVIGIVYIVLAVAFMVAAIIIKKKMVEKAENESVEAI